MPFWRKLSLEYRDSAPSNVLKSDPYKLVAEFIDHWASLPKEGLVPLLRDYLDRPIPKFQPHVTIVDVFPDGSMKPRLIGTARADLYGMQVGEIQSSQAYVPELRAPIRETAHLCVAHPCGFCSIRVIKTGMDLTLEAAAVVLPLKLESTDLGCFVHYQSILGTDDYEESKHMVIGIKDPHWVDLGAGTPDEAPVFPEEEA